MGFRCSSGQKRKFCPKLSCLKLTKFGAPLSPVLRKMIEAGAVFVKTNTATEGLRPNSPLIVGREKTKQEAAVGNCADRCRSNAGRG